MKKIYKGFEAEYETFVVRDGFLFIEHGNRPKYATSFELVWDFKPIQNGINIDNITENEWLSSSERNFKINQLIQAVKQLDKRLKKLEEDKQ